MITFTVVRGITAPEDTQRVILLNTFETYEACEPERNRIGFAMAEAYLDEIDFLIMCEFRNDPKVQTRLPSRDGNRGLEGSLVATLTSNRSEGLPSNGAVPRDGALITLSP